jgi:pimeloyl-ACP methyl ester carboxylesterase
LAFAVLCVWGLKLRRQGQRPFDEAALAGDGGKFAMSEGGRRIEYFVYGSKDPAAPVVVNLHGSGLEARSERELWAPACEGLGVRGISISLPGYGYTDMKPGRVVQKWPAEDLTPVLVQEGVADFMIIGHSQGNPHAMAAALHFPKRCVGLGLNAPFLPTDVAKDVGLKGALGSGSLLRTEQLTKPHMAWFFAAYHLGTVTLAPWLPLKATPSLKRDPNLLKYVVSALVRATVRGSVGGAWEATEDVAFEWKIDPRMIETRNVCVWHAADDKECPAEHGKWLAETLSKKSGVAVDYRSDDEGFGHFTYCRGEFLKPESSMIKCLLDGIDAKSAAAI